MMTTSRKHITIKRVIAYAAITLIFIEYTVKSNCVDDIRNLYNMVTDVFSKDYTHNTTLVNLTLLILIALAAMIDIAIFTSKKCHQDEKQIKKLDGRIVDLCDEINNNRISANLYIAEFTNKWKNLIAQKQKLILKQQEDLANASSKQKEYARDIKDMSDGVLSLYYIMNEEEGLELNKKETINLLKCLRNIDADFMHKLEHLPSKALTPKEELFCMLWRLGKTKDSIMQILGLSKDAYRQIKFRSIKKLKKETSLQLFCDKIE